MEEHNQDRIKKIEISVEKKKEAYRILNQLKVKRTGNIAKSTLFIFHKYSLIKVIIDFIVNSKLFQYTYNLMKFLHFLFGFIILCFYINDLSLNLKLIAFSKNICAFYFIEAIVIIISKGLVEYKESYLRNTEYLADHIVIILSIYMYIEFHFKSYDRCNSYIFIPFICVFRLLVQIDSYNFYLKVIKKSFFYFFMALIFAFLSFMVLLNFQIISLRGLYSHICVRKNSLETQLSISNRRFCGTNKFSFKCTKEYACKSISDSSLTSPKFWTTHEVRNTILLTFTILLSSLDIEVIYDINDSLDINQIITTILEIFIPSLIMIFSKCLIQSYMIYFYIKKAERKIKVDKLEEIQKNISKNDENIIADMYKEPKVEKSLLQIFLDFLNNLFQKLKSGKYSAISINVYSQKYQYFKNKLAAMVISRTFVVLETGLLTANVIFLIFAYSSEHQILKKIVIVELVLQITFLIFCLLRFLSYGFSEFLSQKMFVFDLAVTILSLIDFWIFYSIKRYFAIISLKIFSLLNPVYITKERESFNRFLGLLMEIAFTIFKILFLIILIFFAMVSFDQAFGNNLLFQELGQGRMLKKLNLFFDIMFKGEWSFLLDFNEKHEPYLYFFIYVIVAFIAGYYIFSSLLISNYIYMCYSYVKNEYEKLEDYVQITESKKETEPEILNGYSFFIFHKDNEFRKFCYFTQKQAYFEQMVNFANLSQKILALLTISMFQYGYLNSFYAKIGFGFFLLLVIIIKMIAFGVIFHKGAYLRSIKNNVEFLNIVQILVSLLPTAIRNKTYMKFLMNFLNIPMFIFGIYVFYQYKFFKIAVRQLLSILYICRYLISMMLLYTIALAIITVYAVNFEERYCNDATVSIEFCQGFFFAFEKGTNVIIMKQRKILNSFINFGDFLSTVNSIISMKFINFKTLFSMFFVRNNPMASASDTYYLLFLTMTEKLISNGIFYLTYIAIVLCTKKDFSRPKSYKINEAIIIKYFIGYMELYLFIKKQHRKIFNFYTSNKFLIYITLSNLAFLFASIWQYSYDFSKTKLYFKLLLLFMHLFYLIACLGLEIFLFRKRAFKKIIFYFIILTLVSYFCEIIIYCVHPNYDINKLRYLRIFQVFGQLKILLYLNTFITIFEYNPNVGKWLIGLGLLYIGIFYFFLLVAMTIFNNIKILPDEVINEYQNFLFLWPSIVTLIRICYGYEFYEIADACYRPIACYIGTNCGSKLSFIFFYIFYLVMRNMVGFIFLSMIILFIYKARIAFKYHGLYETLKEINIFWENNQELNHTIGVRSFYQLVRSLYLPYGVGQMATEIDMINKISNLYIPINKDTCIEYRSTLMALFRNSLDIFTDHNMNEADEKLRNFLKTVLNLPDDLIKEYVPDRNAKNTNYPNMVKVGFVRRLYFHYLKSKGLKNELSVPFILTVHNLPYKKNK